MSEKRLDEEKCEATETQIEYYESAHSNDERLTAFTPEEQKKIIRRIDIRLVITLGVLYCVSLIDRGNLSAAVIAGMTVELDMNAVNSAYSIVSLVFFISYVVFQPPATVVIRRIGPHRFLAAIVVSWGAVMIGLGFVPNWQTMAVLRVLLGAFEAGFYPGCVYLLSTWYPRYELQKRNAAFFLIGNSATAFGGIMAYGLMQMDGLGGVTGWRWIFVIEGIVTCILGIGSYFLIVDFPEDAVKCRDFLNQKEVDFILATIDQDRSDTDTVPFDFWKYCQCACDSKVWAFSAMFMLTTTNAYALAYFSPIILRDGMGFSIALTLCIGAAPFFAGAVYMYVQAYYSDKWRVRGPIIVLNCFVGILGTALLGFLSNNGARFFGIFLTGCAATANCPAILTYQANNVRGQWKRALTSATLIGGGAVGGIIGTTVFREEDAPAYIPGIIACLLAYGITALLTGLLTLKFWRANKRAAAGGKVIEGLEGFRYTY